MGGIAPVEVKIRWSCNWQPGSFHPPGGEARAPMFGPADTSAHGAPRLAIPGRREDGAGRIINLAGVLGYFALPGGPCGAARGCPADGVEVAEGLGVGAQQAALAV